MLRIRSLAKINLDLRVLHKRPDGYHELRTLFQTISLADTLELDFTPARRTTIELQSKLDIPDNLIVRAADLLLQHAKIRGHLRCRLTKRIPMGGGLGGGSSNAAAVLLALPVLTRKPVPLPELLELAARLGSDVPFFLFGGTAAAIGRGTEVYPALEPAVRYALLITPGIHVSTPDAYRGLARELTDPPPSRIMNGFQSLAWQIGAGGPGESWNVVNDFESVVFGQHPLLKSIKGKLLKWGAKPALMSGSGSTLYGIFESRQKRDRAILHLKKEFGDKQVHPISLVSRSRYRALWRRQLGGHLIDTRWPPVSRFMA